MKVTTDVVAPSHIQNAPIDISEESDERMDEVLHEAMDVCESVLKIPSANEIFNNLAPKKSGPEYDAAWRDLLAFLKSDLGK